MLVADEDRHKTAFTSLIGLYQFSVMPFGRNGPPAAFQRLMNEVVQDMEKFAHAYLDDLVVFSDSWTEHIGDLEPMLEKLQGFGLTAKMAISVNGQWLSVRIYLGHVVVGGYVKTEINKLEVMKNFPVPKTKKEVRSFLGLTGYYRCFIKEYASIAVPLTNLTRKKCPEIVVVWTAKRD